MTKFLTKTFDKFLSKKEVNLVLSYAKEANNWRRIPGNSFWDNRVINICSIEDEEVSSILKRFALKLQQTILKEYNTSEVPYPDVIDLVRWFPGSEQPPHCDDMSNTDHSASFNHRYFGSVLCLNDNYSGGRTYYPDHNFEVVPKSGTLVIHLGDCDHRHGVTKVEGDIRYTVASFWTFDKSKATSCIDW
jgi:hypothetical protein